MSEIDKNTSEQNQSARYIQGAKSALLRKPKARLAQDSRRTLCRKQNFPQRQAMQSAQAQTACFAVSWVSFLCADNRKVLQRTANAAKPPTMPRKIASEGSVAAMANHESPGPIVACEP